VHGLTEVQVRKALIFLAAGEGSSGRPIKSHANRAFPVLHLQIIHIEFQD
jgi:hypothetical protein